MEDLNIIVGRKVQNKLDEIDMSQTELAERLGVSRQIINKIIHGRKNITLAEIKEIGEILNIDIDDLMREDKNYEADPVIAFMGEIKTKAAEKALKKAKKAMDLIIFHRDLKKEHQKLLNE